VNIAITCLIFALNREEAERDRRNATREADEDEEEEPDTDRLAEELDGRGGGEL